MNKVVSAPDTKGIDGMEIMMLNAVGREIPDDILTLTGKEVFQGNNFFDGGEFIRHGPKTTCVINSEGSKLVNSIHEVLVKCGIRDGIDRKSVV